MTTPTTPASPDSVEREELISHMVNRFLAWKLPKEFYPDSFINFDREKHDTWGGYPNSWPTGTNLFTADQAKAMLKYLMEGYEPKTSSNRPSREWYGRMISKTLDDEIKIGALPAALLAATPARQWVGLTDEEVKGAINGCGIDALFSYRRVARAIESKLREKNAATPAAGGGEAVYQAQYIGDKWTDVDAQEFARLQGSPTIPSRKLYTQPQPSALPDEVVKDDPLLDDTFSGDDMMGASS